MSVGIQPPATNQEWFFGLANRFFPLQDIWGHDGVDRSPTMEGLFAQIEQIMMMIMMMTTTDDNVDDDGVEWELRKQSVGFV